MKSEIFNPDKYFTFGTITFNQEEYIIEHLESIKFQIENFSNDFINDVLIIDDCSSDKTVFNIKRWAEYNTHINIQLIVNSENLGINKNYLKLLRLIKSKNFKVLAGDDIYGPNKIYNNHNSSITFTPIFKLNKKKVFFPIKQIFQHYMNHHIILLDKLLIGNVISAPGVYFKDKKVLSHSYIQYQKKYLHAEDYSSWLYLLFVENIDYQFSIIPTIIHRINHNRNYDKELLVNRSNKDLKHLFELVNKLKQKRINKIKKTTIYLKVLISPIALTKFFVALINYPFLTIKFKKHYLDMNFKSKQFFERITKE